MKYYTDVSGNAADDGDLIQLDEMSFTCMVNNLDACAADSEFMVRYMGLHAAPEDHFLLLTRRGEN